LPSTGQISPNKKKTFLTTSKRMGVRRLSGEGKIFREGQVRAQKVSAEADFVTQIASLELFNGVD